jgi:hypothetical protein
MSKPTLAEIATELGLARSTVAGLKRRGMPTGSVAAARKWRAGHLDPALRKEARMNREDPAVAVTRLGKLAHDDWSQYGERLRIAYLGLSNQALHRVRFSIRVWDALVAPYLPPVEQGE